MYRPIDIWSPLIRFKIHPFHGRNVKKLPNASKNSNPDLYTVKALIKLALRVSESGRIYTFSLSSILAESDA